MLACASLRTAKLEAQQWILHCGHSAQANKALTPGELAVELETGSLQVCFHGQLYWHVSSTTTPRHGVWHCGLCVSADSLQGYFVSDC